MVENAKTRITMTNGDVFLSAEEDYEILTQVGVARASNDFVYLLDNRHVNPREVLSIVRIKEEENGESESEVVGVAGTLVTFTGDGLFEDEFWVKSAHGWLPVEDGNGLSDEDFGLEAILAGEDPGYTAVMYNVGD